MKSVLLVAQALAPIRHSHTHEEWEIGLCTGGGCTFVSEGCIHEIKTGTAYVCPPNTEHAQCVDDGEDYNGTIIRFTDNEYKHSRKAAFTVADIEGDVIQRLFNIVESCWLVEKDSYTKMLSHVIDAIIHLILGDGRHDTCSSSVTVLRELIESKYSDTEFRVPRAIAELGYNTDYMRRLFKSQVGVSPSDYLTDIRIENAKRLLTESNGLSITEVAYSCGFYDSNYFTRLFKLKVGVVPSDYRKSV